MFKPKNKLILLVILATLPAILPIITPGYIPIHDNTQVVRVAQMAQSLIHGHLPVRWVQDLGYGYGYPIFNFYNPLPYYFGSIINLLGINALAATKVMFVFPVILGAIGMYLLTKKYFGNFAGIVASVFYTYAPYHAVQIFVRGSVAEYWAYAMLPFIVYFLLQKRVIAAGVSIALLVLSHNLTSLMALALLGFIFLIQLVKEKRKLLVAKRYALAAVIALSLSAFFWLPAIAEKGFTSVDQMVKQQFSTTDHFVFPRQLLQMPWGFGGSTPDEHDGLSFELGKVHIIMTALALGFIAKILLFRKKRHLNELLLFALVSLLFSLFMMLPTSRFFWANITVLDFLQFPWRYLSFAALATSILAGYVTSMVTQWAPRRWKNKDLLRATSYLLLTLFAVLSAKTYFLPQFKFGTDITSETLLANERVKFEVSNRSDEYRPAGADRPSAITDIAKGRFDIEFDQGDYLEVIEDKTQIISLGTTLASSKKIIFNIFNFPGWTISIDGEKTNHREYSQQKLLAVTVPSGTHTVTAKFKNTTVRTIANVLSLTSLLTVFVLALKKPKILA